MKYAAVVLACLFAVTACGKTEKADKPVKPAPATHPDPDNSGVNARDKDGTLPTPVDQSTNKADLERTSEIRKRVIATDLSMDAKNVKIVTMSGHVTLRGPVKTTAEKDTIARLAREVAGDANVEDLIEVAPAK